MTTKIKFGTDGWRAVIAEDFIFSNVRACAQGVADYLKDAGKDKGSVVIGYDTRYASEDSASACAEVLAGNGIHAVILSRVAPTPITSYTITAIKADGGIMITASHNPGNYNGFKYKTDAGASAPTEVISAIESYANNALEKGSVRRMEIGEAIKKRLVTFNDPFQAYSRHLNKLIDIDELKKNKLRIVVDSMYGAGIGYFKQLLEGGQIQIHEINTVRNPLFPGIQQPEPIGKNLGKLARHVIRDNAIAGFATDGDADRIGLVDENGMYRNAQEVFSLLAMYLLEMRKERGALVKTLTSTDMLYKIGEMYNVPVFETPVGFKYVAPIMQKEEALLGGEESGGYGFRGHIPERDGILTGIFLLDYMVRTGKSPAQLLQDLYAKVGSHYYDRIDAHLDESTKKQILSKLSSTSIESILKRKVVKLDKRDGFRYKLDDGSWLLMRFSGTEPLVRIYAESSSTEDVQKLLQYGQEMVGV